MSHHCVPLAVFQGYADPAHARGPVAICVAALTRGGDDWVPGVVLLVLVGVAGLLVGVLLAGLGPRWRRSP